MGTRNLHQFFDYPDGLMSGFGGAKRDRTADLLHAMQALSQLSYGPTYYCEPAIMAKFHLKRKLFLLPAHLGGDFKQKPGKPATLYSFDEWRPHGDSNPGRHRERVMS